ncbi:DUF2905 domain-containing protein [Parvularcula maris]|uniref:DUF2905 domain-containing protein n=1 Tax=Parvularcula maris TaxID=2965077 RepID=A0A9X2L8C1_9PROT|nr:DUF2905 domain-containing protein [Parvularcula maris]MCQ8184973.1 DUF2905 domain-containing protein [Parvularcula maris]
MQKLLIILGIVLLLTGLLWPWLSQLPFGRLPGDIRFERGGTKVFLPIATCVVLSVVASIVLRLLSR